MQFRKLLLKDEESIKVKEILKILNPTHCEVF